MYRLYARKLPKKYPATPQQQKLREALEYCGIKKGISRAELLDKMKNCIPQYYKEHENDS